MEYLKLIILSCQIMVQSPAPEAVQVVHNVQQGCQKRKIECVDRLFVSDENLNGKPILSHNQLVGACLKK